MPEAPLITTALEQQLLGELRRRGIVVWLDRDRRYTDYVDDLVARYARSGFPYPVVAFRGSFLDTMLALEDCAGGLDPTPLLIHMPGFTEDMMRATPLLELYKAGYRFRRALDTLIRDAATGLLPPQEIDRYLATDYTLAAADEWLGRLAGAERQGLAGLLDRTSLEVVIQELLIKDTFLGEQLRKEQPDGLGVLQAYLERKIGMSERWVDFFREGGTRAKPHAALVDALEGWILCVEYVNDLQREPHLKELLPLKTLTKTFVDLCRGRACALRKEHPEDYVRIADRVEAHLGLELDEMLPEDLGRVDTFRIEEVSILQGAIEALESGRWRKVRAWADDRYGDVPFWLRRDQQRRTTWRLVHGAAKLGGLLEDNPRPFDGATGLEEAVTRYRRDAYEIDRAHRCFEQQCFERLDAQLPDFGRLKKVAGELRRRYRIWADELARDFSQVCSSHGMLPDATLQQRTLFEQVVRPLTRGRERTAVFLVDALRYEMATELEEQFRETGTVITLAARLAELPTITPVGMNALAPVVRGGRLTLAGNKDFRGFSDGEFTVNDPTSRAKAMGQKITGERALELGLAEVCAIDAATLKSKVAQKRLIVVQDREIDEAGEAGVGLATFENMLSRIKSAWHHLKTAGVKQFVVTADHGFMLKDETTKLRAYGKKTDPRRRYVVANEQRLEDGLIVVPFSELGYEGRQGYLLFAEDTSVFDTGDRGASFVHGGNSPQERIIPVLQVVSKYAPQEDLMVYRVLAERKTGAVGCHRVRLRLALDTQQTSGLAFIPSAPFDLALRVPERADIQVKIKDVTDPGVQKGGRLQLPVSESWCEVYFNLEGPEETRARVEVVHPDGREKVEPCQVEGWFDVGCRARQPAGKAPEPAEWADKLQDVGTRTIFVHLYQHGSITEEEAVGMLGTPRKFRRFASDFEKNLALTPLRVRIESTPRGKRYVREGKTSGAG